MGMFAPDRGAAGAAGLIHFNLARPFTLTAHKFVPTDSSTPRCQ
jgi:hypothetical protein